MKKSVIFILFCGSIFFMSGCHAHLGYERVVHRPHHCHTTSCYQPHSHHVYNHRRGNRMGLHVVRVKHRPRRVTVHRHYKNGRLKRRVIRRVY
jgi:hypothetical protein